MPILAPTPLELPATTWPALWLSYLRVVSPDIAQKTVLEAKLHPYDPQTQMVLLDKQYELHLRIDDLLAAAEQDAELGDLLRQVYAKVQDLVHTQAAAHAVDGDVDVPGAGELPGAGGGV